VAGLSVQAVVLIGVVAVIGAFVQAVVGLGVGLVSAPVIALVAPSYVPVLPLWLALLVSGLMLAGERLHVDWRAIAWALPARIPGTVVGAWLVTRFTEGRLGVALAVMVLLAVAITVRAVVIPVNPGTLVTAGFVAGVSGTATSIGGPPIALLFQQRAPAVVRATLAVFFFAGVIFSIGGLAVGGSLDRDASEVALVTAPGVLVGFLVGRTVRTRIPGGTFRAGVLVVCAASAVALLVRSVT
jgi:uncharacterized membrane protein YfcA